MRFMAIITVNNPSMSSADWIEHHTKMKKYTDAFTRSELFAAVNDRQCIISAEMDEADVSKMDEHVAVPKVLSLTHALRLLWKHSPVIQWNKVDPEVRQSH